MRHPSLVGPVWIHEVGVHGDHPDRLVVEEEGDSTVRGSATSSRRDRVPAPTLLTAGPEGHQPDENYKRPLKTRTRVVLHSSLLPGHDDALRSEDHTSELQSRRDLVC